MFNLKEFLFAREQFAQEQFTHQQFALQQFALQRFAQEQFALQRFAQEQFALQRFAQEQFMQQRFAQQQFMQQPFAPQQFAQQQQEQQEQQEQQQQPTMSLLTDNDLEDPINRQKEQKNECRMALRKKTKNINLQQEKSLRRPFSAQESVELLVALEEYGHVWSYIARLEFFSSKRRGATMLKNHYYSTLRFLNVPDKIEKNNERKEIQVIEIKKYLEEKKMLHLLQSKHLVSPHKQLAPQQFFFYNFSNGNSSLLSGQNSLSFNPDL